MPRLKNAVAITASTMVGVTATTLNIITRRTCSRDPAEPRRRSTHTRVSRPASTAPSSKRTTRFASTMANITFGRSVSVTPPDSTTKVASTSARASAARVRVTNLPSRASSIRRSSDGRGAPGACLAKAFTA